MKLIYIAGQYGGKTSERVDLNIAAARHAACQVVRKGWFPVIPHANSAQFERFMPEIPQEFWLKGDIMLLGKCDAALFIQGWENSSGAIAEHKTCQTLAIPIYYQTTHLEQL